MKTLNIEQLSSIAGAEPRGVDCMGRQLDGSDIRYSGTESNGSGNVIVKYTDGSQDYISKKGNASTQFPRP